MKLIPELNNPIIELLFDNLDIGLAITDLKGKFLKVNSRFAEMLGYNEDEFYRMSFIDINHPEDQIPAREQYDALIGGKIDNYSLDKKYRKKDNSYIWVSITVSVVRGENSQPEVLIGTIRDISEEKRTNEKLIESEQKYLNLVSAAPVGIAVHQDDKIVFVNEEGYRLMGDKDKSRMLGISVLDLVHPDSVEKTKLRIGKMLQGDNTLYPAEDRLVRFDGEVIDVMVHATEIEYLGKPAIQVIVLDISKQKRFERELRETEIKFSSFFDHAPIMMLLTNLEKNEITSANEAFIKNTGFELADLINKSSESLQLVDNKSRETIYKLVGENNTISGLEIFLRKKDGLNIDCLYSGIIIEISGVPHLLSMAQDVSELVQIKEALNENRRQIKAIFDTSTDAITVLNRKGEFVVVNKTLCERWLKSEEEMVGLSAREILPEEIFESRMKQVLAVMESRQPQIFIDEYNGQYFEISISPIKNEADKINHVAMFSREITDRMLIENNLRDSEEKFSTLFQSSPDSIILASFPDRTIVDVNDNTIKISGYEYDFLVGKKVPELELWEDPALFEEYSQIIFKEKGIRNFESNFILKDGSVRTGLMSADRIKLKEQEYILLVIRDITDRKEMEKALISKNMEYQSLNEEYSTINDELEEYIDRLKDLNKELKSAKEKAEESDKLKSVFLTNMSHEVRTPLNAIIGFSSLLDDETLSVSDKNEYINIIHRSSDRLIQLIDDILDLSKLDLRMLSIHKKDLSLIKIMKESIESFQKSDLLRGKNKLKLHFNYAEEMEEIQFQCDEIRFRQILDNLISNAIKYSEEGVIQVKPELIKIEGKEFVKTTVSDTGYGIPDDKQEMIFERFRQIEEFDYHEGVGLGLSISKSLVELLGGNIWFDSVYTKGTSFYFTVPFETSKKKHTVEITNGKNQIDLEGKIIIIAEDDQYSYTYLKEILSDQKANIFHAENGYALMNMLNTITPDLILLDISMPIKSGLECLSEIRAAGNQVKIICQTAYALQGEKEKCLSYGCNAYLTKPIIKKELLQTIAAVLYDN